MFLLFEYIVGTPFFKGEVDISQNEKKRRGLVVCCRNGEFKEGRRWYRKRVMGYLSICQIRSYVMMNFMICLSYCFFDWPPFV